MAKTVTMAKSKIYLFVNIVVDVVVDRRIDRQLLAAEELA